MKDETGIDRWNGNEEMEVEYRHVRRRVKYSLSSQWANDPLRNQCRNERIGAYADYFERLFDSSFESSVRKKRKVIVKREKRREGD